MDEAAQYRYAHGTGPEPRSCGSRELAGRPAGRNGACPDEVPASVDMAYAGACAHEHLDGLVSPAGDDSAATTVCAYPTVTDYFAWVTVDIAGTNVRLELGPRQALELAHKLSDAAAVVMLGEYEEVREAGQ